MLGIGCPDRHLLTAHHPVDNARTATRAPSRASGFVLRLKDGPLLSRARSRSKGPLLDQVADAPDTCGQCRSWVGLARLTSRQPNGINRRDPVIRPSQLT